MTVLHIIGWSMVTAVVGWRLAWHRARAIFDRALAQAHAESEHMRAEADRWKANSIRLSKEIAAWKAGHQEGRADVAGIVPMPETKARHSPASNRSCGPSGSLVSFSRTCPSGSRPTATQSPAAHHELTRQSMLAAAESPLTPPCASFIARPFGPGASRSPWDPLGGS